MATHNLLSSIKYVVFLCALLASACRSTSEKEAAQSTTKTFLLNTNEPSKSRLIIENNGDAPAVFQLQLNNQFYYSLDDIVQAINAMPDEFMNEPPEHKAWRFVSGNVKFSKAITDSRWQHNPSLLINSIGNGICDDLGCALHLIWGKMNLQSRVWVLQGHVVPEVFSQNSWHMYDPSHQLVYKNLGGDIAGVEDLAEHPEWIINPVDRSMLQSANPVAFALGHSQKMASIYSSKSDNFINEEYDFLFEPANPDFILPAGSRIVFPATGSFKSSACNSFAFETSRLVVELKSNMAAELSFPLVVSSITGSGMVNVDGKEYDISSDSLHELISDYSSFHQSLKFSSDCSGVKVYYHINSKTVSIKKTNTLVFTGGQLESLHCALAEVEDSVNAPDNGMDMDSLIKVRFLHYEELIGKGKASNRFADFKPRTALEIIARTRSYFEMSGIGALEVERRVKILSEKIIPLMTKLPDAEKQKRVFAALADPYIFIVFLTYVEHCSAQEVMKMMS